MTKYATRINGVIDGFALKAKPNSDPTPIDEASQEWIDYLMPGSYQCSKLQMVEELASLGKEDALFAILDNNVSLGRRWNAASSLAIHHPMVVSMGDALGYNSDELQVIFNAAAARE